MVAGVSRLALIWLGIFWDESRSSVSADHDITISKLQLMRIGCLSIGLFNPIPQNLAILHLRRCPCDKKNMMPSRGGTELSKKVVKCIYRISREICFSAQNLEFWRDDRLDRLSRFPLPVGLSSKKSYNNAVFWLEWMGHTVRLNIVGVEPSSKSFVEESVFRLWMIMKSFLITEEFQNYLGRPLLIDSDVDVESFFFSMNV